MDENRTQLPVDEAIARVIQLEAELEVSSEATTEQAALARRRATLHAWIDTVTGVVATPGVGRVVLLHANGQRSGISSAELPMLLADPIRWDRDRA